MEKYDTYDESLSEKFSGLNLQNLNKSYKPYRDQNNNDNSNDDDDDDDKCTVTSYTSTIMNPQEVRAKVRKGILSRLKREHRRLKNKGENAMVTARNRDINDTIKLSLE